MLKRYNLIFFINSFLYPKIDEIEQEKNIEKYDYEKDDKKKLPLEVLFFDCEMDKFNGSKNLSAGCFSG